LTHYYLNRAVLKISLNKIKLHNITEWAISNFRNFGRMQTDVILKRLGIQELNQMQKSTVKAAGNRNDVMVLSPTGSGKTIAFLLPVFEKLENENKVQTLIIVPARELALQIEQVFKKMTTEYKVSVCYGGHDKKSEINELAQNPAVVIATPGRLAYHMREKSFNPAAVHTLVLDEFDKALELGFEDDMRVIVSSLKESFQTILTSATRLVHFPNFINTDNQTVLDFLKSDTSAPKLTFKRVSTISEEKLDTLFELLCEIGNEKCLVFCNHREATDRISALLKSKGIARETFHGGMEQDERERALIKFRNGSSNILLTTDLAARGLDIPEVAAIVHYQLPPKEDAFIHRNGRTARMKAEGTVYLIIGEDENFPFISSKIPEHEISRKPLPGKTNFETIYLSAGKKDKVNKVDIVGFFIKKGQLEKDDIGLIEVKDTTSYVAVRRQKVSSLLHNLKNQKLKNKKLKIEIAY